MAAAQSALRGYRECRRRQIPLGGRRNELTWEAVGRSENCVIWYATGKVKPGLLMPTIPIKAVVVLTAPRKTTDEKLKIGSLRPTVAVYLQTDSRAATAMLRILGPAAPHMAEQAAEQFLLFFSGVARHIHAHPDEAPVLLAPPKTKSK